MEKNSETELGARDGAGGGLTYAQGSLCPWYGHLAALVLIIIAVFLIYAKTLHYPFIIDDTLYIIDNRYIKDLSNFFPPFGTRYLGFLSFALNYRFSGLDPASFRFVNIVIHAANATLVYILVTRTLATPSMERLRSRPGLGFCLALSVALIFATHPIQTQAVTYITQRLAALVTFFYLAAMILYVQWRTSERGACRVIFYILALFVAVAAQMTKEISFTLPFSILLYEFVFFGIERSGLRRRVVLLVPFLLTMLTIPINLFGPEIGIIGDSSSFSFATELRNVQIFDLNQVTPYNYLVTQFRVVVTYLRLLVLPIGQMFSYDYDLFTSIFVPEVFVSFLFLLAIFSGAVYLLVTSLVRKGGVAGGLRLLISFGIIFFFVTISIESSIIPIRDLAFEHRLYLPSIGASLAFSAFFFMVFGYVEARSQKRFPLIVATALLILLTVVPLGVAAYRRNTVWSDRLTFYLSELERRPDNAEAYNNLGIIYAARGRLADGISEFKTAIRLDPVFAEAHKNLGRAYASLGRFDEAIGALRVSVALKPDYGAAHYSLARVYEAAGRLEEAALEYQLAIRLLPTEANMRFSLGMVYERLGLPRDAIEAYSMVVFVDPDFFMAHFRMGDLYASTGQAPEAATSYRKFISSAPAGYEREKSRARAYIETVDQAAKQ